MSSENKEPGERIAKRMARAGLCSRREAEQWIKEGRVKVNGKVLTSPAFIVSETDKIDVDEAAVSAAEKTRLFLFHKPTGLVTTARDEKGRPTVFEGLPRDLPRLVSVGRLDMNSEGLLLLTNDGELARYLELPAQELHRVYRVRVYGAVDEDRLGRLHRGITVKGVVYKGIDAYVEKGSGRNVWLNVTLQEGKNREIRKVMDHLGLQVNRLIRLSYGPFEIGDLPRGALVEVPLGKLKRILPVYFATRGKE